MRSHRTAVCVFGTALLLVGRLLPSPPTDEPKPRIPVDTGTLNTTHQLIGWFGKPLGEVFTVTARIEKLNDKAETTVATVTSVDGRALQKPEQVPVRLFHWANIRELKPGMVLTARAYQDGGMVGIPYQAMKETMTIQSPPHHFGAWLVIIKDLRDVR